MSSLLPGCTLKISVSGESQPPPLNVYCTDLKKIDKEIADRKLDVAILTNNINEVKDLIIETDSKLAYIEELYIDNSLVVVVDRLNGIDIVNTTQDNSLVVVVDRLNGIDIVNTTQDNSLTTLSNSITTLNNSINSLQSSITVNCTVNGLVRPIGFQRVGSIVCVMMPSVSAISGTSIIITLPIINQIYRLSGSGSQAMNTYIIVSDNNVAKASTLLFNDSNYTFVITTPGGFSGIGSLNMPFWSMTYSNNLVI